MLMNKRILKILGNWKKNHTNLEVSFWPHLRENHYTDDGGDHHHIFGGAHMEDLFSSHMLEESRVAL